MKLESIAICRSPRNQLHMLMKISFIVSWVWGDLFLCGKSREVNLEVQYIAGLPRTRRRSTASLPTRSCPSSSPWCQRCAYLGPRFWHYIPTPQLLYICRVQITNMHSRLSSNALRILAKPLIGDSSVLSLLISMTIAVFVPLLRFLTVHLHKHVHTCCDCGVYKVFLRLRILKKVSLFFGIARM